KKGTDVQVKAESFQGLMEYYREMSKVGVGYNLFGHFGDAHLHFNYMPMPNQINTCQTSLENLYQWVKETKGSTFAEHVIGLLKKKFIKPYFEDTHYKMFSYLKEKMDPEEIFFPQGFMLMD
ncbi:MAG: hypothetical protein NXH75_09525, partial [Halobacteriovoraceae bacterium]|nr:hypothetical protein [Halobacteriovoraceae bacterium]